MERASFNENSEGLPDIYIEGAVETSPEERIKLRDAVVACYKEHGVDAKLIEQFVRHNGQVEGFVSKFSKIELFTGKQQEIAELAAILHDIAKGYGDFLEHGKVGGEMAENLLLEMGKSPELAYSVKLAIERHMGPAGYPTEKAKAAYGQDFEYPKYATEVGQMVYDCDILTQLTQEGFEKLLMIRELSEENTKEDEITAEEKGRTLNQVRYLSVLNSARKSLELIKTRSVKDEAEKLWQKIEGEYKEYL